MQQKYSNKIRVSLLLWLILAPLTLWSASADDLKKQIADRETEIKKLEAEIKEYNKLFENQSTVSRTLSGEVKRLETQIKKINADIKLTEYQIQKTNSHIGELSRDITVNEYELAGDRDVLTELLQTLNESDNQTLIEALFAHDRLTDFLSDRESTMQIQKTVEREMAELRRKKTILEDQRQAKEQEEIEYKLFRKDLSGKKSVQESVTQTKSQLLKDSKNQESRYQKLLKERAERRALISKELESIEEELRRSIDPSLLPTKRSGVLSWPIQPPTVTQGFGRTEFAATLGSDVYNGGGHNGIDFRAPVGTRISAADAGTVKDTGNTDTICPGGSYGKWVIIEHANNLSTLYAHLSAIAVVKGASVSSGDILGYSGSTGYVTGPHLHFTVYATNTYQLRKTKHCGLIPAGGYLNPLDYL